MLPCFNPSISLLTKRCTFTGHLTEFGGNLLLHFLRQRRTRTDKTHFAAEHVEQLGKLVDTRLADELPDLRGARIILDFECGTIPLVEVLDFMFALLGIRHHRTELVEFELPLVHPDALLGKKHRAWTGELD